MEKTLKEKTTSALIWSFIDKFGQQIIYIATGIVLGRILTPDDYGLVGSLVFFTAISTILVGSGYNRAILNKAELTQEELSTLFFYNVGMGVVIYILLFFGAPYISLFYREPLLTPLSRVLFLTTVFNSLLIVNGALLTKKMDLTSLAKANLFSLFPASVVAILMAVNGFGVWSLVVQTVLFTLSKVVVLAYYSKWRPSLTFNNNILKELFPFSSKFMLTNLINTIFNNIYYVLIGRFYNPTQLGYYTQANKYQDIPTGLINNTFRAVSMPILSEINQDKDRLKRILSKLIRTIAFIGFPVLLGMILIAKPLFILLITEKWLPSVPVFQTLCVAGLFVMFSSVLEETILSRGHSGKLLMVEVLKKIVLVALIIATLNRGLIGLATGWAVSSLFSLLLSIYLTSTIVGYSFSNFMKDSLPYLAISSAFCIAAYFISLPITNNYLFIGFCMSFVGIFYLMVCRICKLDAAMEIFKWTRDKIRSKKK